MNKHFLLIFQYLTYALFSLTPLAQAEDGVSDNEILIGSVLALEGNHSSAGKSMKLGLEAAFKGTLIDKRQVRLITANDSGDPFQTSAAVRELLEKKVFLFAGNTGTPTVSMTLPLLQADSVPAVEFLSPSELLRYNQINVLNFRPNYVQEVKAIIQEALKRGIAPTGICAYVQNDSYGLAGLQGMLDALKDQPNTEDARVALDKILSHKSDETPQLNGIGPVGFYTRTTLNARAGYDSLRAWETQHATSCKLIVTIGPPEPIGRFIGYARSKSQPWLFSAVSVTGEKKLLPLLQKYGIKEYVLMTQVVPPLDDSLTISKDAKKALGNDANVISEEGYIVGKLVLYGLKQLTLQKQAITRQNFMNVFTAKSFNLDGLPMNFTDDNQGSDLVVVNGFIDNNWVPLTDSLWKDWLGRLVAITN